MIMDRAAVLIPAAVISGIGVAVAGYYTYKYFETGSDSRGSDCSSLGSCHTAVDYSSTRSTEYFDAQEEQGEITDEDLLYVKLDELMEGDESKIELAYSEMEKYFEDMSEYSNFLWRYAKVHYLMGQVKEYKAWELNGKGLKHAEKALKKDPENPEAHKWFAILKGAQAQFLKNDFEKADNAKIFFEHIQKALKLNPEDWELHHLLGVFEYKLANLSAIQKVFARSVFKGISQCKYSVAKNHFNTVEKHNPKSSKETKLFLAKCFYAEKNFEVALKYLNEALEMKIKSINDKACQKEAEKLRHDYTKKGHYSEKNANEYLWWCKTKFLARRYRRSKSAKKR